jgi:uncharacterized protein
MIGRRLLLGMDLIPLTQPLVELAASISPLQLRSLDAVQLASALTVKERLSGFVTYDARLGQAAGALHLEVIAPR